MHMYMHMLPLGSYRRLETGDCRVQRGSDGVEETRLSHKRR